MDRNYDFVNGSQFKWLFYIDIHSSQYIECSLGQFATNQKDSWQTLMGLLKWQSHLICIQVKEAFWSGSLKSLLPSGLSHLS